VIAMLIVMVDEGGNGLLQLPGEIEVLQTKERFEGAMITFDFALGLRMEGLVVDMGYVVLLEKSSQLLRDISRAVIRQ
jgi:hypothetical protein